MKGSTSPKSNLATSLEKMHPSTMSRLQPEERVLLAKILSIVVSTPESQISQIGSMLEGPSDIRGNETPAQVVRRIASTVESNKGFSFNSVDPIEVITEPISEISSLPPETRIEFLNALYSLLSPLENKGKSKGKRAI